MDMKVYMKNKMSTNPKYSAKYFMHKKVESQFFHTITNYFFNSCVLKSLSFYIYGEPKLTSKLTISLPQQIPPFNTAHIVLKKLPF